MHLSEVTRLRLVRLGKIFSNYCIATGVFMLFVSLTPAATFVWWMFGFAILILAFVFKLMMAWQAPYSMVKLMNFFFNDSSNAIAKVYAHTSASIPYVFAATVALAAAATVLILVFDRYKRWWRVGICVAAILIGVFALVVVYKFGGFFE